jgi:hypothetical protein
MHHQLLRSLVHCEIHGAVLLLFATSNSDNAVHGRGIGKREGKRKKRRERREERGECLEFGVCQLSECDFLVWHSASVVVRRLLIRVVGAGPKNEK